MNSMKEKIKELLNDKGSYSLTHIKCGGYVDLDIINGVITTECRNCHEKQEIKI
jgi:hypothetical protein